MRKFDSVVKFAQANEQNNILVQAMEDYARHYCAEKMSGVKYSYDSKYTLTQKAEKLNNSFCELLSSRSHASLDDFDGSVVDYAGAPAVVNMGAFLQKVMLDTATPIVVDATGLATLAEVHYGGYGDVFEFELKDDSIYNVSKMGRRQKHTKTQTRKANNKTIATEFYGLTTIATLPEIIQGDAMVAEDAMLKALSMTAKIYQLVIDKFITETGTIVDTNLTLTNWDEKQFLEKLRYGSARNNAKMTIVGDTVALKDVLPDEARTRILLADEYNTAGYMSIFNGYNTIGFGVVSDGQDGVVGLPTDKIYGVPVNGSKLIHIAIGATMTNTDGEWDNNNLAILSTLRKELGVELATNKKVVRVDL